MPDIYRYITVAEKTILVLIALFTIYAVSIEMWKVLQTGDVALTDLLLMFIYAEVLGMVARFYKYRKIPITIPSLLPLLRCAA